MLDKGALGQHDQAALHLEEVEHVDVLARLRHHTLVGRDHEQRGVKAVSAREHVAHETRVAGHVHDPDLAAAR